jgi:hypothetical protein
MPRFAARAPALSDSARPAAPERALSHFIDPVIRTRPLGTPIASNRSAYSASCTAARESDANDRRKNQRNRLYPRKLRSLSRPLMTATGTPRSPHAATKLGQSSSSTSATTSGRTASRKRRTDHEKSRGYRTTSQVSAKSADARASPVSVVVETITVQSSASIGTSDRSAFTSPTDTACSTTRARRCASGPTDGASRSIPWTRPNRSRQPRRRFASSSGETSTPARM